MANFIKKGKEQKPAIRFKTVTDIIAIYGHKQKETKDGEKGNRYRVR